MEPTTFLEDSESMNLCNYAQDVFAKGYHNKALEIVDDLILVHKEDKYSWILHLQQGEIFCGLGNNTKNIDLYFTYMLGAVGCFSVDMKMLFRPCVDRLHCLARAHGLVLYYKKLVNIAKQGLSLTLPVPDDTHPLVQSALRNLNKDMKSHLENLIKDSEHNIAVSKTCSKKNCKPKVGELKKSPEPLKNNIQGLRSYWLGLDIKVKRDFMKVSIAKLLSFVEGVHYREGRYALEKVLASAREDRKWAFWMCRTKCSKKFSSDKEYKDHLEKEHSVDFKPSLENDTVKRIGKVWDCKISGGAWEPVDTVAAVEMIKNRLTDVKTFAYKNGWAKEWPLAVDEKRSQLLKEIKTVLVKLCKLKILPCSIRDYVMLHPVTHLGKLGVSKQNFIDSHLMETPQSICFLECDELNIILCILKYIKCERDDGTDVVHRVVENILGFTRVKEKIDFDLHFSFLLLDRRLLKSNNALSEDKGTISVFDPDIYYAKTHPQEDDIIYWLTDYNLVGETFPRPIREYNLGILVAVLRAIQFTCRTLRTKYEKKMQIIDYNEALCDVENLCMSEDERRRNLQDYQWNRYASLLCDGCEERVPINSLATKSFLRVVRDVLQGAVDLTSDFFDFEACMNLIRECKKLSDEKVLKSIDFLKSTATRKALQMDSKILLVDNSRISLLEDLTRLSVFDNRTYILQMLKPFLLNEIVNMESKAKSDAVEVDLLLPEEKQSTSKKKKNRSKRNSISMSSPLNKTVEHKPSVNLEPVSTSPSLKTVEEVSIEQDDTLANENQEEGAKFDPGCKRASQNNLT